MVAVTETFDPFEVEQGRRHHEAMAELRATCPVARLGSGMLVVSRYDDVRSMLTDPHMSNTDAARAPGVTVPEPDRPSRPASARRLRLGQPHLCRRARRPSRGFDLAEHRARLAKILVPKLMAGRERLVSAVDFETTTLLLVIGENMVVSHGGGTGGLPWSRAPASPWPRPETSPSGWCTRSR